MSVSQLSVFLESKPGHLRRVLDSFEEAGVSVRGYSAKSHLPFSKLAGLNQYAHNI